MARLGLTKAHQVLTMQIFDHLVIVRLLSQPLASIGLEADKSLTPTMNLSTTGTSLTHFDGVA
jgi:hypothetical protein